MSSKLETKNDISICNQEEEDDSSLSAEDMEIEEDSDDDGYNAYLDSDEFLKKEDVEKFNYESINDSQLITRIQNMSEMLGAQLNVTKSQAVLLLLAYKWAYNDVLEFTLADPKETFAYAKIMPNKKKEVKVFRDTRRSLKNKGQCSICFLDYDTDDNKPLALGCEHEFCASCWSSYIIVQLNENISLNALECMAEKCSTLIEEEFLLSILPVEHQHKYNKLLMESFINGAKNYRGCTGPDCKVTFYTDVPKAKRVDCTQCGHFFCFSCGTAYHPPATCDSMVKWYVLLKEDTASLTFIVMNTKKCPKCEVPIEKNGGCNHMRCSKCHFEFCWICAGDWKAHSNNYNCNRFQEDTGMTNKEVAAEVLRRQTHFIERWANHSKSLDFENDLLKSIKTGVDLKIQSKEATYIECEYLYQAAKLLQKSRYTLKYTYAFAYFMETGAQRNLFEYQQSELEREIENFAWKMENVQESSRFDILNQMDVVEKRRMTLLRDFMEP